MKFLHHIDFRYSSTFNLFRKEYFLFFVFLSLFFIHTNSYSQWEQQISPTTNKLNSVHFIDDSLGWAAGAEGVIIHTTNGGLDWTVQNSGISAEINKIFFIDELNGFCAGKQGLILETTNGGIDWNISYVFLVYEFNEGIYTSLHFTDKNNGFVVGYFIEEGNPRPFTLFTYTTDGGNNWTNIMGGNGGFSGNIINDVYFLDQNYGWIGTTYYDGYGWIYKTTDGGYTWWDISPDSLVYSNEFLSWASFKNVHFVNQNNGRVLGNDPSSGFILKTLDGGRTWAEQFMDNSTDYYIDIEFEDYLNGFSLCRNFGSGFNSIQNFTESPKRTIKNTYLLASKGNSISVYNKDNEHKISKNKKESDFKKATSINSNTGSSKLSKTTNGGASWSPLYLDFGLNSMSFVNKDAGWIVGDNGIVFKYNEVPEEPVTCPPGMISYWKLDERSGNIYVDELGINNAIGVTPPGPVTGQVSGAQQFDGSTTKIDVPANPSFDFAANGSFSVEFWYKGTTVPSTAKSVVGRYIGNPSARWWVGLEAATGRSRFYLSSGGSSAAVNGSVITDGNWHHVVATHNGTTRTIKIYVDGILGGSTFKSFAVDFSSPTASLNIGWYKFQNVFALEGTLDEVAIHNLELSSSVIQEHYNKGLSGIGYCGNSGPTAPIITSTPQNEVELGQQYYYDVDATGNPAPTYSLQTFPSGMTINSSTGEISWTPTNLHNHLIKIEANNGINPTAIQEFNIAVEGTVPYITSLPITIGYVGKLYTYDVEAVGNPAPDYLLLTYPSGMTIDVNTGMINWLPTSTGSFNVTVAVRNEMNSNTLRFLLPKQSFIINVSDEPECPAGMISYWKLNETSGTTYVDEQGINNGFASTAPVPITGIVNGSQQFNGVNSGIDVPANSSFDFPANGSFSVEFWYKGTTAPSTAKSAVGRYIGNPTARWWTGLNALDGRARFYLSSGGSSAAVNGAVITDGNWHHVVATRNGTTKAIKIYVDGILSGSSFKSFAVDFSSPTANLNIGWYKFQSVYALDGSLDEVAIYNIELSSIEILNHYNNGLAGSGYCEIPSIAYITSPFSQFITDVKNKTVLLNWQTIKEVSGGFIIERKNNNFTTWEKIGSINSQSGINNYAFTDNSVLEEGKYTYRIKSINKEGGYAYSDELLTSILPTEYFLSQNYPNPFNPVTKIKFSLPESKRVTIKIYSQLGEEVTELTNKDYEAGSYEIEVNARNLASGVYLYRMTAGNFTDIKKFILVK